MSAPLRTVVVGLGKIGAGYADDPVMARFYPYATHAQVLRDHPAFEWGAAVDLSDDALRAARERWGVRHTGRSAAEVADYAPEVAVLATPPESRIGLLEGLPSIRAVLVEKPLGRTLDEGERFLAWCRARGVAVQVALWRRCDTVFRQLAAGGLAARVGRPQAAFVLYGNGLLNNGTHMVDFVRMLLGEVEAAQAVAGVAPYREGPIEGDTNVAFSLRLACGIAVSFQGLRFARYRENGVDIWGEGGRLSVLQEGLSIRACPVRENRAMQGEREVDSDGGEAIAPTVGRAFYEMYTNLADAVRGGAALWSSGESALRTARVVEAVLASAAAGGAAVEVGG